MTQAKQVLCLGLGVVVGLGLACSTPVGVRTANPRQIHRYLTRSALTTEKPSDFSEIELRRYDLVDSFAGQPRVTLANLHAAARAENFPNETLFALAELSFLHAEKTHEQGDYAAAMVYAWALLYPEDGRDRIDLLDPRARIAADLYNRALTSAFRRDEKSRLIKFAEPERLEEGVPIGLPFGRLKVSSRSDVLRTAESEFFDLRPVTELEVRGIRNRYRAPGMGAPLAAHARPREDVIPVVPLGEEALVPLTAIVLIEDPISGLTSGHLSGRLTAFSSQEVAAIPFDDQMVPLEAEPTAALAASLAESQFWKKELQLFLGNAVGLRQESKLVGIRPYRDGRIPVVFVHGTASSPARWADMINDLMADGRLSGRYAYWTFSYDSGNPIAYSGMLLRKALAAAVERADPSGTDPCVQDMIVMGHSQGGLLTKQTAIDSGDRFWKSISDQDFEAVKLGESQKKLLRDSLFVKPLPFVTEVIFLATPHRGSYLAGPQFVRRLAERLVRLPSDLVRLSTDLVTVLPQGSAGAALIANRIPTSIDNMSPSNNYIQVLATIPVVPEIRAHSIIAIGKGDKPLDKSTDGVVKYTSAHVDGVDSEITVRSPHSGMQAAPATIEEVRRILLAHSAASRCPAP
ncbi:MAG: alpha/beta hydrolase [Myxococcota bacterium]